MTVLRHHRRSDTSPPVDPERCRSVGDGTRRCNRISPVQRQLHWPPVRQRVGFKVAVLVHRAFTRHAPNCLTDDCCLVTDARPRILRSADTRTLLASRTRTNFCDRAFSVAGPCVWNYLPTDLRQPFQKITEDIFILSVGPDRSVNSPRPSSSVHLTALSKSSYLYSLTISTRMHIPIVPTIAEVTSILSY